MSAERTLPALRPAHRMLRPSAAVVALIAIAWAAYLIFLAPASGAGAGLGAAAFLLGVRHGFDADHIAAIDNVTRRLASAGRASASVGLWFALGHSTVVFAGAMLLGAGARFVLDGDSGFSAFTSVWGPAFSGVFLIAISVLNVRSLIRSRTSAAEHPGDDGHHAPVRHARIGAVARPWHMYPIGMLFGLGFDTATSVALLVASAFALSADPAVLAASVVCLPLLFTAGMSMVDTADSALMTRAYTWSRRDAASALRYDLIVTGATLIVGVGVGLIQLASAVGSAAGSPVPLFEAVEDVDATASGVAAIACVLCAAGLGWAVTRRRAQPPCRSAPSRAPTARRPPRNRR